MQGNFDRNFFTQIGLDSGSLTMLASIVHSLREPGEYRGVVHRGTETKAIFFISANNNSPVAQVNIDLATLGQLTAEDKECCGGGEKNQFVVNPKGYAVFHVSGGAGGYSVLVRRAEEDPKLRVFDSRELREGDIFSAIIIRPGTYSVSNLLTEARGEVTVSYPKVGETPYRPPAPVTVECTERSFEPGRIALHPAQGLNFHVKTRSRIKIELLKPDDGPGRPQEPFTRGWKKTRLPNS